MTDKYIGGIMRTFSITDLFEGTVPAVEHDYFITNWAAVNIKTTGMYLLLERFKHVRIEMLPVGYPDMNAMIMIGPNTAFVTYNRLTQKTVKIGLSAGMNELKIATSLLHELGHVMDYGNRFNYIIANYQKNSEKRAWRNAIKLSEQYNIPIDYDFAAQCLASYGMKYIRLENRRNYKAAA